MLFNASLLLPLLLAGFTIAQNAPVRDSTNARRARYAPAEYNAALAAREADAGINVLIDRDPTVPKHPRFKKCNLCGGMCKAGERTCKSNVYHKGATGLCLEIDGQQRRSLLGAAEVLITRDAMPHHGHDHHDHYEEITAREPGHSFSKPVKPDPKPAPKHPKLKQCNICHGMCKEGQRTCTSALYHKGATGICLEIDGQD